MHGSRTSTRGTCATGAARSLFDRERRSRSTGIHAWSRRGAGVREAVGRSPRSRASPWHDWTRTTTFFRAVPAARRTRAWRRTGATSGRASNWALRQIGKRGHALHAEAVACAERVLAQDTRARRWIAKDALRELRCTEDTAAMLDRRGGPPDGAPRTGRSSGGRGRSASVACTAGYESRARSAVGASAREPAGRCSIADRELPVQRASDQPGHAAPRRIRRTIRQITALGEVAHLFDLGVGRHLLRGSASSSTSGHRNSTLHPTWRPPRSPSAARPRVARARVGPQQHGDPELELPLDRGLDPFGERRPVGATPC